MERETQQSGDWIGRRPMHATNDRLSSPLAATLFAADRWRRWRGGWLDALDLGPRETPWRSIDVAAGVRLHCYDGAREPDAVPVPVRGCIAGQAIDARVRPRRWSSRDRGKSERAKGWRNRCQRIGMPRCSSHLSDRSRRLQA